MKKKKILLCIIVLVILVLILAIVEYKNAIWGNNINRTDNTDILDISSYEAQITVEVYSNKNTNKYIIKQTYLNPNSFIQEVIEPSNIKGLTITREGVNTIIENKRLGLKTLCENFQEDSSNLSLISFINEYKEGTESETIENEQEKVMKTKIMNSKNRYQMYQNLYISKTTNLPTKMEILDINKNTTIYILYNEIRINQNYTNSTL